MSRPQPVRRKLLATLHDTGAIADRSGRATSILAEAMGYKSRPVSLSPLLSVLEEDGLVRREVRGRRCFLIELTPKGRALVGLDEGLDSRRIGLATREGAEADRDAVPTDDQGMAEEALESSAVGDHIDASSELLRRQLRDVLMELGALRHRVAALERKLEGRSGAEAGGLDGTADDPGTLTPHHGRAG